MNRDEIHNMPAGLEIDELIARTVMEQSPCDKWQIDHVDTVAGTVWGLEGGTCNHQTGKCYPERLPPHYSSNIEAAWLVVEKISDRFYTSINNDLGIWNVDFWSDWKEGDDDPCHPATGETLPLAICRAALLATIKEEGCG